MARYVAFLRAINVGGHVVKMAILKKQFERIGFRDVETFIASGNVVFSAPGAATKSMARKIEAGLEDALGYEVATFIRTPAEIDAILKHEPFEAKAIEGARALCVGFLSEPLDRTGAKALMDMRTDVDDFHVFGREVYWLCRVGQSESAFSNVRFENAARVRATYRGMNTLRRLAAKYPLPS